MTDDEARRRFAEAKVARLATVTNTGEPHLVPICFAIDGATDTIFSAVDAKPKTTPDLKRLRNIEANPNVTLLVDHYEDDWTNVWWVRADGRATVNDPGTPEHGRALLVDKYAQYRQNPDALGRIVVVQVQKWTSWAYADLG